MSRTHHQEPCPGCGRFSVWKRGPAPEEPPRALDDIIAELRDSIEDLEAEGWPADSPEGRLLVNVREALAAWDAAAP